MAVSAGSWQSFDLLRRRREELGLEAVKPASSRELLLRGGLIAASLVGLAGVILAGCFVYGRWLQGREDSLKPVGAQYQQLQSQLTTLGQQVSTRTANNQALAEAIASVASSSVLLGELAVVTPKDLQLQTAVQQGSQLTLTGTAVPPNGLRAINALQLQLEASPLFVPAGVQVVKILEQAGGQGAGGTIPGFQAQASTSAGGGLSFELKAAVAPAARRANLALLQARGATGLLRRLQVLQQEGLLR